MVRQDFDLASIVTPTAAAISSAVERLVVSGDVGSALTHWN
jgi:hypothetical protein